MLKKIKFLSILITSLIFLLSCSNEPAEVTKIKFMAGYKPQANLPFVAAYVKGGFPSLRSKWYFEHKKWIKVIPRDAYTYLHFRFFDGEGKIINV